MQGTNLVTNSGGACFKSCRKKFYWSYEMGWRSAIEKDVLRIGSMVHEGLDMMAKGVKIETVIDAIANLYDEKIIDLPEEYEYKVSIECQTVLCLIQGYHVAWGNSKVKILESEASFNLPIINPAGNPMTKLRQAGKRDRIGLLPDGRVALMETKTCSEDIGPGSDYRNILAINQQISMYVNAALAEGKHIETTLYDCIRKPDIRPCNVPVLDDDDFKIVLDENNERVYNANEKPRQTASTKDGYSIKVRLMTPQEWAEKLSTHITDNMERYYQRFEVPRMADDLAEFNVELWQIAKDILECRNLGRWYRNTSNCKMWNSLCPYYVLCAGERDLSNGVPAGFRQVETVHEELV